MMDQRSDGEQFSQVHATKKRTGCLTTYLVFMAIGIVGGTFQYFYMPIKVHHFYQQTPFFTSPVYQIFLFIVNSIILYGIWRWKKWAVISELAFLFIGGVIGLIFSNGPLWLYPTITGLNCVLWYFALRGNWQHFN